MNDQYTRRYNGNPAQFGRVAVLCGGWSAEREVSLKSGEAIFLALKSAGINVVKIDVSKDVVQQLLSENFDSVFIALHGIGGEDGKIQALLDLMNIPYTGSQHAASAIAMNKLKAKQIWLNKNIMTPNFVELSLDSDWLQVFQDLNKAVFVKPVLEGSSLGMSYVTSSEELKNAYLKAASHNCAVMAEQAINGREFTVALLNGEALPPIELTTDHTFYDYEAKYISNSTHYFCPVDLSVNEVQFLQHLSLSAFAEIGCIGWGRADFIRDEDGDSYLLEVNTVPGMTDHSLVPMAAKEAGLPFKDLVLEILMQTRA